MHDAVVGEKPVRSYRPAPEVNGTVLWLHGGSQTCARGLRWPEVMGLAFNRRFPC